MMKLFKELDEKEVREFREWARNNYVPFDDIKGLWHPVIQRECVKINEETEYIIFESNTNSK